jgi:predicted membrane channel-forming protein YqfA (hemolysin III family)
MKEYVISLQKKRWSFLKIDKVELNMIFFIKILIAATLISFASWLSGQYPKLAGFIIALPIASLIAIIFSYYEHQDVEKTITFTKSILIAVPVSYLFFLPFFFANSLNMNFWLIYVSGIFLLVGGYFIHKYLINFF